MVGSLRIKLRGRGHDGTFREPLAVKLAAYLTNRIVNAKKRWWGGFEVLLRPTASLEKTACDYLRGNVTSRASIVLLTMSYGTSGNVSTHT